jgi:hypothetical protein
MKKSTKALRRNHVNIRLDDPTYSRMTEIAKDKDIPLAAAIRISLNRTPAELQNEIQSLRLEVKEMRLLQSEILPQLSTKLQADSGFATIASILEMIFKKLPK